MSVVWGICGAGKGVGKTTIATALVRILPRSIYAKCGHGKPEAGKPRQFFNNPQQLLDFIDRVRKSHENIIIESNSNRCLKRADIVIFIDGVEGRTNLRSDTHRLKAHADIVIGPGSESSDSIEKLQSVIGSSSLVRKVLHVLLEQKHHLLVRQLQIQLKTWIEVAGTPVFGKGLASLLQNVHEMGTLQAAAEAARISYRHAWGMIRKAENHLGEKLIFCQTGGSRGGKSVLTDRGQELLTLFTTVSQDLHAYAEKRFAQLYHYAGHNSCGTQ